MEIPEEHHRGHLSVENLELIRAMDLQNCDVGFQAAWDGRVWVCVNGVAFLRFKPERSTWRNWRKTMESEYRPGLKEYGMAIELIGNSPRPTPEEITEGGRIVAFNFEMTRSEHPEFGLDNYRLVSGPSLEVWEYGLCSSCNGAGSGFGGADCDACGGEGEVPVGLADPPRWKHNFGWYSLGPAGVPPAAEPADV